MGISNTPSFGSFSEAHHFISSSNNAFTAIHVNIRSIRKHWNHFCALISSFVSICDIFVLTEINTSADCISSYSIPGYQLFSYTRSLRRGGGVAVFVKDAWSVSRLTLSFSQAEVVALRLCAAQLSATVLSLYRPPCCNVRLFRT